MKKVSTKEIQGALPLVKTFYSLQGEGANTGMPAFFIRLAGCDVGCHWCDVKESWDENKYPLVSVGSIIAEAKKYKAVSSVITGGEPLMHDLNSLTAGLKKSNIATCLETSGAFRLTGVWDWICLSPKKNIPPLSGIFSKADELKIIIYNSDDFGYAEECASEFFSASGKTGKKAFLQPEWGRREAVIPRIINYIKKNPRWKLSLQTHKYIGIE